VSAPLPEGAVHLLVLDDSLAEGHRYRGYLALCGTVVPASSLPCSLCLDGCDCDPLYCPACVHAAASWNAEAGRAEEIPGADLHQVSGSVIHEDSSWTVHVR